MYILLLLIRIYAISNLLLRSSCYLLKPTNSLSSRLHSQRDPQIPSGLNGCIVHDDYTRC